MQLRRLAVGSLLGLLLLAPAGPAAAQASDTPAKSSCCQMTGHEKTDCAMLHRRCPLKPAEATQCCSACPLTLALINFASVTFVFDDGGAEILKLENLGASARPTRPPYPPPRSSW